MKEEQKEKRKLHLIVKISRKMLLEHKNDEVFPIAQLKKYLKTIDSLAVEVVDETYTSIELKSINVLLLNEVEKFFTKEYNESVSEDGKVSVEVLSMDGDVEEKSNDFYVPLKPEPLDIPEQEETHVEIDGEDVDLDDSQLDEILEMLEPTTQPNSSASMTLSDELIDFTSRKNGQSDPNGQVIKNKTKGTEELMKEINDLIGFEEFKELAEEINTVAPEIIKNGLVEVLMKRAYLFAINAGCGFSTALDKFSLLLESTGLKEFKRGRVVEYKLPPLSERDAVLCKVWDDIEHVSRKGGCVIGMDMSEWMTHTSHPEFIEFLSNCATSDCGSVFVFRIPYVEQQVIDRMRKVINDSLFVKTVLFAPLTPQEIRNAIIQELAKHKFKATNEALKYIDLRIVEEKKDGKFYGLHTVAKVVNEVIYLNQLRSAKVHKCDFMINTVDAKQLCANPLQEPILGEKLLEKMRGMDSIKEKINEIITHIELARDNPDMETPCMHMRFVGNPGTGKTTVARIVGKIMKERGLLRRGDFFECAGRDLCGKYIGETAPKTSSICREAYGSVLFIDEAYSLYRGDKDNTRDYGVEAIDTLIAEMENHRSDLVVIMAGYTDDMERLMSGNAGLASRVPHIIEFPNFTKDELFEIFKGMLENKSVDDDLLKKAKVYFDNLDDKFIKEKEFSNARFVRNLVERIYAKASTRTIMEKSKKVVLTGKDFDLAIADKEFSHVAPRRRAMGFDVSGQ